MEAPSCERRLHSYVLSSLIADGAQFWYFPFSIFKGIESEALAATGIDFTGALLTLNAGSRVWSWTRGVKAHTAGSNVLTYDGALIPERGGPSALENLFFVSGVLDVRMHPTFSSSSSSSSSTSSSSSPEWY